MILLIGHGYWGKNIAKTLGKDLYAICDSSESVLREVSTLYPHVKLFDSIDEAIKDKNIKAIIIATKAATHFDIAQKAIINGKDLWIEKPACLSVSQIDELILLAAQHHTKIFVDHIMCYDSTVNYLKQNINLKNPLYFESYRLHQGLFQPDTDVIYDLAIHDLSIIDFLYPGIKLQKKEIIKNKHVNDLTDHAVLNMEFENDLRVTITCSWVSPIKQRQLFLHCGDSMIAVQDNKITIRNIDHLNSAYSQNSITNEKIITVDQTPGLQTAVDAFKKMIYRIESPITDIHQARRIQQWIEQ